jgi:U3 small nucleolar RNA-associated protein 19
MLAPTAQSNTSQDPFDSEEKDPMLTNALDSSLWELVSHRNHYHPSVSTLAKIFQEAFRKPNYALEDFLDHTYGTVRCNNDSTSSLPIAHPLSFSCSKAKLSGR